MKRVIIPMSSKYQIWITANAESEKILVPVNPEEIKITHGSGNESITISGLGEIPIFGDRPAIVISFSSFLPATKFSGINNEEIIPPLSIVKKIIEWKNSKRPVHFLATGTDINQYCTIEEFTYSEKGGDVGTIYYDISFKEYREVSVKQIQVNDGTAEIPEDTETRTDNRLPAKTYEVKYGDCLWNIAQSQLGDATRWREIYDLNKDIISSSFFIYVGQVLKLP